MSEIVLSPLISEDVSTLIRGLLQKIHDNIKCNLVPLLENELRNKNSDGLYKATMHDEDEYTLSNFYIDLQIDTAFIEDEYKIDYKSEIKEIKKEIRKQLRLDEIIKRPKRRFLFKNNSLTDNSTKENLL